jgi:protein-S-isoprenylcysteine O-methyltransferase Ste14
VNTRLKTSGVLSPDATIMVGELGVAVCEHSVDSVVFTLLNRGIFAQHTVLASNERSQACKDKGNMTDSVIVIMAHQLVFQGMFMVKNFTLRHRLGKPIRGANIEANISIGFFAIFIALSIYLAAQNDASMTPSSVSSAVALFLGVIIMISSLVIAWASLKDLGDSWRVGVIEDQETQLIETGIYRFSRNPYFLAYLCIFAAYTVFLKSPILLVLSVFGFAMIHGMVRREEKYLAATHGETYLRYQQRVPRYLPRLKF